MSSKKVFAPAPSVALIPDLVDFAATEVFGSREEVVLFIESGFSISPVCVVAGTFLPMAEGTEKASGSSAILAKSADPEEGREH